MLQIKTGAASNVSTDRRPNTTTPVKMTNTTAYTAARCLDEDGSGFSIIMFTT
jgi:hypothetical protein